MLVIVTRPTCGPHHQVDVNEPGSRRVEVVLAALLHDADVFLALGVGVPTSCGCRTIGHGEGQRGQSSEIAERIERALAAHDRPLALVGRSGCRKTTLLRRVLDRRKVEARFTTARDLADTIVDAIRRDAQGETLAALAEEARPLVVEHLEDLCSKPRTLEELRRLLEVRTHHGGAVLLTLTTRSGTRGVARWLARNAEVARPHAGVEIPP